jgi:peptidoglycan/LPS O-acetylase OafA/YrhL
VVAIYFCFPAFHEKEALAPLWKFLTFCQNLGLDIQHTGTFSHAWSLCVEEHFYFILPIILIALLFTKHFNKAYWLLIILFLLEIIAGTIFTFQI